MAKLPCVPQSRIFTFKATGETMSYDQVRQYLMENPDLWLSKGEQKTEGKKADPVLAALDKGKIKGVAGMNAALWNTAIDTIKAAYSAGKALAEAINEGIAYLKSKGEDVSKYQDALDDIRKAEKPRVATFFSGAGTMEAALPKSESVMAVEYSPTYMKAYNDAFGTRYEARDVTKIDPQEVKDANPDIFHASPVCKNFSKANSVNTVRKQDMDSAQSVARVIREAQPPVVTIENVLDYQKYAPFEVIIQALKDAGYTYDVGVYNAADYGGVQNRRRLLVRAVKDGKLPALPEKQKPGDWYKALKDLIDDAPNTKFVARTKEENWEVERINKMIADGRLDASKPIITMGASAYKNQAAAANSGGPSYTLLSSSNAVPRIIMPDGRIKRVTPEMMKRLMDLPLSYPVPADAKVAKEVLGNGMDGAFTKALIEPLIQATPEQKLKQAFDKWKAENNKVGIVPNWEKQAKADIELFKAVGTYLAKKLQQGAYSFEKFIGDLGKINIEKIDEQRAKWKGFYDEAVAKGKAQQPPVTPPLTTPPTEEGGAKREMPEGEEKETEKPILGRAFRGTTDEAIAEKLAKLGLYRNPDNIEEGFKIAEGIVSALGIDEAVKLGAEGQVANGFIRIGILKAILADINNQRDALEIGEGKKGQEKYLESLDELADKYAEALAAFSPRLTEAGQIFRAWQEIIQNSEFEFDYEGRKVRFKKQFGDEAYTKEVDERFKQYDEAIKKANEKIKELEDQKANQERQSLIDNIAQESKKEPPTSRKSFFKEAAERIRKLAFSKPGIFSSATPASLAWDASVEAVALALDGLGTLEVAVRRGLEKMRSTDWYKNLNDNKKSQAETEFKKSIEGAYIPKAIINDDGKIEIPKGTLKAYVEAGYKNVEDIVDDIYKQLNTDAFNVTKRDVRDVITGYGKTNEPTKNDIRDQMDELKAIGKIISAIEDLEKGIAKEKNPNNKKELSDRRKNLLLQYETVYKNIFGRKPSQRTEVEKLKALKERLNDLEEGKKKTKTPPSEDSKEAKDLRERIKQFEKLKTLQDQLKELQQGIVREKKTRPEDTLEEKALKDQIKAQKEAMGLTEAARYATAKRNIERAIVRLRTMKPRPEPKPPVQYDKALEKLSAEKFRAQEEWDSEFRKAEQKKLSATTKFLNGAYSLLQLPKSVLAGGIDLGVIAIQGMLMNFANARITGQAFKNLGKGFVSETSYQNQLAYIRNSDLYRIIKRSGLDINTPFDKQLFFEQSGADTLTESIYNAIFLPLQYIPKVGPKLYDVAKRLNFIRAFNRAQVSYTNTLKVGNFMILMKALEEKGITFYNNPKAYEETASIINTMSGRSSLGNIEKSSHAMKTLNLLIFSPKNWASVLRTFTPLVALDILRMRAGGQPYKLTRQQEFQIKTMAKFIASVALFMFISKSLTDGNDEDEEDKKKEGNISIDLENPQSSAFGKIRVGNQIFDPYGGRMQLITLQARLVLALQGKRAYKDPYTGIEKKIEESYFKSIGGLIKEYGKGKLAPSSRIPIDYAFSTPVPGKPGWRKPTDGGLEFYMLDPVLESFENITAKSLLEIYGEQPLGIQEIAALATIGGLGTTTLNDPEDITTVGQIQNLLSPGEGEVKKFSKAFSSYLKAGDYDMAEKVFDKATGSYQLQQTIQQQQEAGKAVGDVERKLARKRKQSVKDLFENIREDNLVQKYSFEKRYRDEIIEAVYKDEVLPTSGVSEKKQQMFERINALTPEMKEDIKRNYDLQYEELMTVTKGLDKVAERADNYYEKKAKRTPWVKQYLRLTGKEEKQ